MKVVATRGMAGTQRPGSVAVLLGMITICGPLGWSQDTPSRSSAPATPPRASAATAIDPRVDTSAPAGAIEAPSPTSRSAPAGAVAPAPATGAAASPSPANAAGAGPRRAGRAMDRVDLESSQITGNRELPRVLYIVPWRAPAAGEIEGRPVNSLLFELTKPVDRDVFRRENRYFDALQATAGAGADPIAAPGVAPGGPEK